MTDMLGKTLRVSPTEVGPLAGAFLKDGTFGVEVRFEVGMSHLKVLLSPDDLEDLVHKAQEILPVIRLGRAID